MTGEYDGFNIEELWALIKDDNPDKLDEHAQGWSNAAAIFKTEYESLQDHMLAIQDVWTSASAKPYLAEIGKTIKLIETSMHGAEARAESLSAVASYARQANQGVKEQYDAWVQLKAEKQADFDAAGDRVKNGEATFKDHITLGLVNNEDVRRKPYDDTGRTYLNNLAENAGQHMNPVKAPVPNYKPVEYPAPPSKWDGRDWDNMDFSGPNAQQYAHDGSGLATSAHVGGAPSLQSGAPVTATPPPGAPTPVTPTVPSGIGPTAPPGIPVGPIPPSGRPPTAPVRITPGGTPPTRSTNTVPRTGNQPGRTPSLNRNSGGRSNLPNRSTNNRTGTGRLGPNGRNTNQRNGRGLSRSQMAPKDRTGRVRGSNEVLGRRSTAKGTQSEATNSKPTRRSIRPVVRGGNSKAGNASRRAPSDQTKRGYTKQVIGERSTINKRFSRTPRVASKVHDPGRIFGKRQGPVSPEEERRKRLDERHARREAMRRAEEGLSRPVIGGIAVPEQLRDAEPTPVEPVKAENEFWHTGGDTVTGIIGARRPMPEQYHDAGPGVITSSAPVDDTETTHHHDPGATAFRTNREAPTTNWP